jgi:hypothetical protein
MKYASQLSVRTVVASGTGSSAAGLTATAVREGSSWALQVGSHPAAQPSADQLCIGGMWLDHLHLIQRNVGASVAGALSVLQLWSHGVSEGNHAEAAIHGNAGGRAGAGGRRAVLHRRV